MKRAVSGALPHEALRNGHPSSGSPLEAPPRMNPIGVELRHHVTIVIGILAHHQPPFDQVRHRLIEKMVAER